MTTAPGLFVRLAAALALALGVCEGANAQAPAGTPAWVVEQYVSAPRWDGRAKYFAGEMERYAGEPTPGMRMPPGASVTVRQLEADARSAVFAVTARVDEGTFDAYVYLRRDADLWQITAFRRLALPGLFYLAFDSLVARPGGFPEDERVIATLKLTVAPDSALKQHFADHAAAFDSLARAAVALPGPELPRAHPEVGEPSLTPRQADLRERMQRLLLTAISRDEEAPGCLLLVIGGMIDNSVGYLYAPPGCTVPRMSPDYFIHLEALRPGWYVYKTT